MKSNRFLKFIIILLTILAIFMIYKHYFKDTKETMQSISHEPIFLAEDEKIHFYFDGFAISGLFTTRFYDPNGTPISSPFPGETATSVQHTINMSTPNFMLIDGNSIYRTSISPFEKIYELDVSTGYGIKEFDNNLIVLIEDETNILVPKLYSLDQSVLIPIKDIDSLYYMDSSYDSETNCISVLALSLDASFPSSKVFNYINGGNTLFSVISAANKSYYKILRIPSYVILVGTHEIICYNIDGTLQWTIKNKEIKNCTIVENEDGFLFYFLYPIDNGDGIFFNALEINSDGSYNKLDFPRNLINLQSYKKGYIGLKYGRNILILDKDGSVEQEAYISEDIVSLYYSKYHQENFYLLDRNNQLHIYSTKREASQK